MIKCKDKMRKNLTKIMKKYKKEIAFGACSLVLGLSFLGCEGLDSLNEAGPGKPYSWLTDEEKAADARRPKIIIDSDDGYWRMEHEMEKLRRLERQEALEAARIREHTRLMLKRMELERKLREQR